MNISVVIAHRKFELGQIVSTPGALAACSQEHLASCLARHAAGDWGNVCSEDAATNEAALKDGCRLLSAYPILRANPAKATATIRSGSSPRPTAA